MSSESPTWLSGSEIPFLKPYLEVPGTNIPNSYCSFKPPESPKLPSLLMLPIGVRSTHEPPSKPTIPGHQLNEERLSLSGFQDCDLNQWHELEVRSWVLTSRVISRLTVVIT